MLVEGKVIWNVPVWKYPWGVLGLPLKQESSRLQVEECQFRPSINAMAGYVPGEQPKPGTKIIKLNTNENPYPPSPTALKVLRNLDSEWLRRL